jgi:hypothetical protein
MPQAETREIYFAAPAELRTVKSRLRAESAGLLAVMEPPKRLRAFPERPLAPGRQTRRFSEKTGCATPVPALAAADFRKEGALLPACAPFLFGFP